MELQNGSICNVTVTYTHPGQNDNINVEALLPIDNWNGRLQAVGGGGWSVGRVQMTNDAMLGGLAEGFSTITTDGGLGEMYDASPWALFSPGNVNLYNLQNFAFAALHDEVCELPPSLNYKQFVSRLLTAITVRHRQATCPKLFWPGA